MKRRNLILASAAAVIAVAPIGMFLISERPTPATTNPSALYDMPAQTPPVAPSLYKVEAVASAPPTTPSVSSNPTAPSVITDRVPRIAYRYGYRFRLSADGIGALQERHLDLCRRLGDTSCRVVAMRRGEQSTGGAEDSVSAQLDLQVAAAIAPRFGQLLSETTGAAGGETADRSIEAEDLSRAVVDSEARIRTREILIRRLSTLLETRSGNIQQAVEAERAINQAQEELEAARAWQAEIRSRVAMSEVQVRYVVAPVARPTPDRSFASTIGASAGSFLSVLTTLAMILVALLPWAAIGFLAWLAGRAALRHFSPAEATS